LRRTIRAIAKVAVLRRQRAGWAQFLHRQPAIVVLVELLQRDRGIADFGIVNHAVMVGIEGADERRDRRSWSIRALAIRSGATRTFTVTVVAGATFLRTAVARTGVVTTFTLLVSLRTGWAGLLGVLVLRREVYCRRRERQRHQEGCVICFHVFSLVHGPRIMRGLHQ
jgi:hypothetical protein